jgi:hypothetical protein
MTALLPQSFNVKPSNVSVHEGGEALLLCQVANRGGQVQWVKDGLALGEYNSVFSYSKFVRCSPRSQSAGGRQQLRAIYIVN